MRRAQKSRFLGSAERTLPKNDLRSFSVSTIFRQPEWLHNATNPLSSCYLRKILANRYLPLNHWPVQTHSSTRQPARYRMKAHIQRKVEWPLHLMLQMSFDSATPIIRCVRRNQNGQLTGVMIINHSKTPILILYNILRDLQVQ